jgi:hypothetical protein
VLGCDCDFFWMRTTYATQCIMDELAIGGVSTDSLGCRSRRLRRPMRYAQQCIVDELASGWVLADSFGAAQDVLQANGYGIVVKLALAAYL